MYYSVINYLQADFEFKIYKCCTWLGYDFSRWHHQYFGKKMEKEQKLSFLRRWVEDLNPYVVPQAWESWGNGWKSWECHCGFTYPTIEYLLHAMVLRTHSWRDRLVSTILEPQAGGQDRPVVRHHTVNMHIFLLFVSKPCQIKGKIMTKICTHETKRGLKRSQQ